MIPREIIQKILEAGAQAPSGSNSQPWKFCVRGDEISIYAYPEKDHPILNFRNRGTWFAHGAMIENMAVAAVALGYSIAVKEIFSDKHDRKLIARVTVENSEKKGGDKLHKAVFDRTTNRKIYKNTPLVREHLAEIESAARGYGINIYFTEDKAKIRELAHAVSRNEVVMFENKELHKLFFEELVWTEEELHKKNKGLYLHTMELGSPQRAALKIIKRWGIMNFLNKSVKIARQIAKDNIKVYASAPLMGVAVVKDEDKEFISAGRSIEKIWLTATNLGLSLHLISGISFLWQRIHAGQTKEFSEEHIRIINDAYEKIKSIFGIKDGVVAVLFRIGDGGEPTARSPKKPPEVTWEN